MNKRPSTARYSQVVDDLCEEERKWAAEYFRLSTEADEAERLLTAARQKGAETNALYDEWDRCMGASQMALEKMGLCNTAVLRQMDFEDEQRDSKADNED